MLPAGALMDPEEVLITLYFVWFVFLVIIKLECIRAVTFGHLNKSHTELM